MILRLRFNARSRLESDGSRRGYGGARREIVKVVHEVLGTADVLWCIQSGAGFFNRVGAFAVEEFGDCNLFISQPRTQLLIDRSKAYLDIPL